MGQDNCKPQPGDLIEIDRPFHQHWALYMGNGYVINLTPAGKQSVKLEKQKTPHTVALFTRMVTMQRLKKVVRHHKWRVNNKSDQCQTPLPVEEIIQCAEAYIGKEMAYCSFGRNCEHFVKKLRYGEGVSDQLRAFVDGELHILDTRDDKYYPMPGDLIEIKRPLYQHWAIYVGGGYVIHVTAVDEGVPSLSTNNEKILIVKVTKEVLKEVVGNDAWAVNNKYDSYCSPLPVEDIIQRAEGFVGRELVYDVFEFESEDFVTKVRYGGQLRAFVDGELHILDTRDDKYYPMPGDLIEIKRPLYQHWAIYVGGGYVIHVTAVDEGVPSLSTNNEKILIVKVTKEVLKEVVGNDAWAVNNKYDSYCSPLPVEDIIQRAEGFVGRELVYDVFEFESEDFVTKVRYGGQLRAFVDGELHILDTRDDKYYPMPGDLIEIKRPLYQHWAIYVGGGYVIHVTAVDENSSPMSASSVTLLTREAKVKKELLEKAAGNDNWHVNNKYDRYRSPFPAEEIIRRAERQVGRVVLYRLLYKNCEHFVTEVRYGEAISEQALRVFGSLSSVSGIGTSGVGAVTSLSIVPSGALLTTFGVGALATVVFACNNIAHTVSRVKFKKAGRDILEQKCC